MPLEARTTDQPSTKPPFADTLGPNRAPALSASSDVPIIVDLTKPNAIEEAEKAGKAAPVDKPEKADDAADTSGKTEGEANTQPKPQGEEGGEEKDQTSPQQRAAFARERNRRQAAEREAAETRAQIAQLAETVAKLVDRDQPKTDAQPARDAFDSPEAYDKALIEWSTRRATEAANVEAKASQARAERARQTETLIKTYEGRKSSFEADHPDFDDVVLNDDLQISPPMSQAILEAEDGPAIAYHLGQNPEVAERISKLSPAQAVYEIGKISTKLATPPAPKREPIRPIGTRNTAAERTPDEMSMDEYYQVSPNGAKRRTAN